MSGAKLKSKIGEVVHTSFGDWTLGITRNMSLWHHWMSSWGHWHHSKDFGINTPNYQLAITKNGTLTSIFFCPENIEEYSRAVLTAVNSINKIKKLKIKYQKFARELGRATERCSKNLDLKNFDDFIKKYHRFCAGLFLTSTIGRAGLSKLLELLKKDGIGSDQVEETVSLITYPEEHSPLFQSRLDLLLVAKKIQDKKLSPKKRDKLLRKWLDQHACIPVNFCEDPWTITDAKKQLKEMLGKNCAKEFNCLYREHKTKLHEKKRVLRRIDNKKITILASALAEGTYLNEFRKNIFSKISLRCRPIFTKIAKLGGSKNWRDCFYLLPEEMRFLLQGGKLKIAKVKAGRKIVGYYTDEKGVNRLMGKKDLDKFKNYLQAIYGAREGTNHGAQNIRGFVANKGKAVGIARVILSARDFNRLKRGDILVTAMTSVDFVPVMERAAAFVTNEGGITSHASIVAREMNKPCIIGTKIATQVFKDGDLVEVDANKGVVRKIKYG